MVQAKLEIMKKMMKSEFIKVTRGMDGRVENLTRALTDAQKLAEHCPMDAALTQREQEMAREYMKIKGYQFLFYRQRTKSRWLKEGDANTKYFHSIVKGRMSRNSIKVIKCASGELSTDQPKINREFVSHFKTILAQTIECSPIKAEVVSRGRKIDGSQYRGLIREVTYMEIWNALNKIDAAKSPGPDGFSYSFFKTNWNILGNEFCTSVRHCLKNNALPRGMNAAFIALIPKTKLAAELADYMPISCCNVVYKVISGVLADRLKEVLPGIVDLAQGAFIKGRSIIGNVYLAQQLVTGYDRKNISERMAWKIDLRKAYDTVDWSFLKAMLRNLDFPLKFISWITMCMESTSFSIQINGDGRCSSILAMKQVLEEFLRCFGLTVNVEKIQLFTAEMDVAKQTWVENLFCTKTSLLPVRYLGFPLTSKSISAYDCLIIIQRITERLDSWNNQFLSRAGRRVLIQSVLQTIVYYWARISILPKKSLKVVNALCGRFLWCGRTGGKGAIYLIEAQSVSIKKEGGLGIKNMKLMNDAMVLNQLWDLNKNGQNLWIKWIHAYWTKGTSWWENESLSSSSWVLRRLSYCKLLSDKCVADVEGSLRWIGEGGGFTVKDTYRTLKEQGAVVDWHKLAWNRFNSPRASFNAVLVAKDRLLTKARLRNMGMNVPSMSVLCDHNERRQEIIYFLSAESPKQSVGKC
ncbi:unnamed protein product [Rhodiola kirilowii]